ncbi:MAG: lipid A deacylase LpxR family protein [Pseudomonadota bacterium]
MISTAMTAVLILFSGSSLAADPAPEPAPAQVAEAENAPGSEAEPGTVSETVPNATDTIGLQAEPVARQDLPAGDPRHLRHDDNGTLTFIWENDKFGGTDRNYTNGNRLSYLSPTQSLGSFPAKAARVLLQANGTDNIRYGLAVGHSIFTPEDTQARTPRPNQHPYAGYVYGEAALQVESAQHLETISLQLGLVGDEAGGEQVQNNFHRLIGVDEAQGWDNQLKTEPAFMLTYDRSFRSLYDWQGASGDLLDGYGFDITPSVGFSLGNVRTQAQAGLTFRLGQDLRQDFGPPRVRPALAGGGFFDPPDNFSWYIFAGVAGRAVAYNMFLDGNLLRDGGPRVDRRPLVADFQVGIAMQLYDVQLAWTYVTRTEEFKTQGTQQQFGAVSLSYKF